MVSHALWTDQCAKHLHAAYEWDNKEILGKICYCLLDDILFFSKTLDEHLLHIHSVLERLREEKLLINLKKCSFAIKKLVYLGFVVSPEGLKMDPEKVKAILEWPTPWSSTEVRSFHGLVSYYKKFIKNFSGICAPLTDTIRGIEKSSNGL